ncbi:MAG: hypothetical protein AAF721_40025, partial [Myxococcota bacterium]
FDVFSNGGIQIAGNARVTGGLYSGGPGVRVYDAAVVQGEMGKGDITVPDWIPSDEVELIWRWRDNDDIPRTDLGRDPTSDSNLVLTLYGGDSLTLDGGLYYFNELSLSGGATLEFTSRTFIVVDGPMEISTGSSFMTDEPGDVLIIGTDDAAIEISDGASVSMRMYAPYAPVQISGDGTSFTGALVGGTLQMSGASTMEVTEDALHIWNPC